MPATAPPPRPTRPGAVALAYDRWVAGTCRASDGELVDEMPVALVYNGVSHAVMMATPTDLADFALGFSLSEGIVAAAAELLDLTEVATDDGIELRLTVTARRFAALKDRRRSLAGPTGCGLCGIESLRHVARPLPMLESRLTVGVAAIHAAAAALPKHQALNHATHASHAAAWAGPDGDILVVREDVGRHNALDKLIGARHRAAPDLGDGFAVLTSRLSVELVQKAVMAGIPLLAGISAPTALAVRLAQAHGLTLVAPARAEGLSVMCHGWRIAEAAGR